MKKSNDCNTGCIKKVSDPNNFSDLIDMYVAGSIVIKIMILFIKS